ncbi:hypothetical protein pipiens_002249 [Culex pipiens pipiens]|uniref:Uncharacterized protein n=1 Tax=Culex pipiens pipiens TaxID=38569 RepID=A0ABD1DLC8_CULPP
MFLGQVHNIGVLAAPVDTSGPLAIVIPLARIGPFTQTVNIRSDAVQLVHWCWLTNLPVRARRNYVRSSSLWVDGVVFNSFRGDPPSAECLPAGSTRRKEKKRRNPDDVLRDVQTVVDVDLLEVADKVPEGDLVKLALSLDVLEGVIMVRVC